jgi:hypothetical protein
VVATGVPLFRPGAKVNRGAADRAAESSAGNPLDSATRVLSDNSRPAVST